jgi:S1-C subfamily serine protease
VVGTDPTTDISILKIDAPLESLFPVELGESTDLKVGQRVFAIGNPYGLERTMSVGIISSLNRTLAAERGKKLKNMIQLDAALNQGNSGGPLLDTRGRLIGMNTAIASLTGQSSGVGFAVPVNVIKRTIPELIQFGKVVRASLGLEAVWETRIGVGIAKTERGGAAENAGLQGGLTTRIERMGNINIRRTFFDHENADIILSIDGVEVNSAEDINNLISEKRPGDRVALSILRRGQQTDVTLTLGTE